ncbi:MAG: hypothetical protein ACOYM0_01335 [Bacteroidales bacterium]
MDPRTALDLVVCNWIQHFENIHPFTNATHHIDEETGDEFITVFDPKFDNCIVVWLAPAWYGNDVLNLARSVLASKVKR